MATKKTGKKSTSKKTREATTDVTVRDATGARTTRRGEKTNDALEDSRARRAATAGETDVIVTGRPAEAERRPKRAQVVEITENKKRLLHGTNVKQVKAIRVGYYGHKRRRIGEVFDMRVGSGELPSWVIDLSDAEPGQDEGTRGLHSGGREDDRIREERNEERGIKKSKKTKIVDPTIIEDALPLTEGGNERKPDGGDEHVI